MEKKRIAGIDIIKCLAVIFVMSIHQIGMTHVQAMNLVGTRAFIIMLYRYIVMSCVPLFMMTTGYLQSKKEPNTKFYKGIIPILVTYIITSAAIAFINIRFTDETFNIKGIIIRILNFTENNYAWYVEMFIGLYLLIPFINKMYHAINTKRQKQLLLYILVFLTVCPTMLFMCNSEDYYYDVFPDYWTEIYPITYYLLGAYIKEYKPKINKILNLFLILLAGLFPNIIEFIKADGGTFVADVFNGFNSLSAFFIAYTIFLFFYDTDINIKPIKLIVRDISVSTLEIYLWSNGIEKILYPKIPDNFPMRLPAMIIIIFVCSYITAKLQRIIIWSVKKTAALIRKKA